MSVMVVSKGTVVNTKKCALPAPCKGQDRLASELFMLLSIDTRHTSLKRRLHEAAP